MRLARRIMEGGAGGAGEEGGGLSQHAAVQVVRGTGGCGTQLRYSTAGWTMSHCQAVPCGTLLVSHSLGQLHQTALRFAVFHAHRGYWS